MERVDKTVRFEVHKEPFELEFLNSYEIRFRRLRPHYDGMKEPIDEYTRVEDPKVAIGLFKAIVREVKKYLYEEKPPFVFFTAGFDAGKMKLYKRMAKGMEPLGYIFADDPNMGNAFYVYKKG